jgi:hypothetical protein
MKRKLWQSFDYYEPIKEWKMRGLQSVEDVSNVEGFIKEYEAKGAFTYYDPIFNFVES